jgi:hypothetical protein
MEPGAVFTNVTNDFFFATGGFYFLGSELVPTIAQYARDPSAMEVVTLSLYVDPSLDQIAAVPEDMTIAYLLQGHNWTDFNMLLEVSLSFQLLHMHCKSH